MSTNAVLRAGTLFWGLTLLFPQWDAASVVLHHELRVALVDLYGLLILTEASEAQRELLTTPTTSLMAEADAGDLTSYFDRFASALWRVLDERLQKLVLDGVLSKRGARKNAVYVLAGRDGTGHGV